VGKTEGMRSRGISWCIWKDNIKWCVMGSSDKEQVTDCVKREREREREKNPQDAALRCLLLTSVSTCFGHQYAHLQENKDRVLLHMVYCAGSAGCGW